MPGQLSLTRGLTIVALLLAPHPARATPACGGSTFTTCASVTVTKILLSNGNVRVRFEVMNQAGLAGTHSGTRFTYIGLWGLPATAVYVDSSLAVGGTAVSSAWRVATPTEDDKRQGLELRDDMRGVRLRPLVTEGLRAGQPASFEFDLSGVTLDEVNVRDWEIHAEAAGAAGAECATNLIARNGTLNEAPQHAALCAAAVVTPEPASVILLATGLAGLAGIVLSRRS